MYASPRPGWTQILSRLGFIALLCLAMLQSIDQEFSLEAVSGRIEAARLDWQGLKDQYSSSGETPNISPEGFEILCRNTSQKKAVYCVRHYPEGSTSRTDTFLVAHFTLGQDCPTQVSELPEYTQTILAEIAD